MFACRVLGESAGGVFACRVLGEAVRGVCVQGVRRGGVYSGLLTAGEQRIEAGTPHRLISGPMGLSLPTLTYFLKGPYRFR